ncbi:MAG: ribonuclease D [Alphaproteobacteria bacterium]
MKPTIHFHKNDLPADVDLGNLIAVDTEAMGLNFHRDQLCLVQLSAGDGHCHLVQLDRNTYDAPNLKKLLGDDDVTKIFHFARFDVAAIYQYLDVICRPVFCTKIASKLVRTYTDQHGLKHLCRDLLGVEISKQEQSSDWGAEKLTTSQQNYAATDVLHLHKLKEILEGLLERERRTGIAQACFDFLPYRCYLDLLGFDEPDIFRH